VIAYKFLAEGAVAPFTGFRWPRPGEWVEAPPAPDRWVHACRARDLPHWLDEELWSIELGGPLRESRYQVASPRARLVARVAGWDPALRREYARACALRARELALPHLAASLREALAGLDDLASIAAAARRADRGDHAAQYVRDAAAFAKDGPAVVSYIAATLASHLGGGLAAFEAERAWQARWLAERLGLERAPARP
jgi:hypothetical protein